MPEILASVGKYEDGSKECYNTVQDQRIVIDLLNAISTDNGGTEGAVRESPRDGVCIPRLHQAIITFQRKNALSVDGHIDPHHAGIRTLNELADEGLEAGIILKPPPVVEQKVSGVDKPHACWAASLSSWLIVNKRGMEGVEELLRKYHIYHRLHPNEKILEVDPKTKQAGDGLTPIPGYTRVCTDYHLKLEGPQLFDADTFGKWSRLMSSDPPNYLYMPYVLPHSSWWHTLVVYGATTEGPRKAQKVYVMNPALGLVTMPMTSFEKSAGYELAY